MDDESIDGSGPAFNDNWRAVALAVSILLATFFWLIGTAIVSAISGIIGLFGG